MTENEVEDFIAAIVAGLTGPGYAVMENVLSARMVRRAREEMDHLLAVGKFHPAGIGRGSHRQVHPEIRRDGICWLDESEGPGSDLFLLLARVREGLNRELQLGLWDFEAHYAIYRAGAFYRKHFDRFQDDSKRTVSVVFFFNPDWTKEDGGALLLHLPDQRLEILPQAGTAVFFLSNRILHEVTETRKDRMSLAGWFRTR